MNVRVDVDYAYPHRWKSFLHTAIGFRFGNGYLRNSKIIAGMINHARVYVKAYWFFTYRTIPDCEMLRLMGNGKHEIGLHAVNNVCSEANMLEARINRVIKYYTVHGVARWPAHFLWRHWHKLKVNGTLEFFDSPRIRLDALCYDDPNDAYDKVMRAVEKGSMVHVHPDWLFQNGTINQRGRYYEVFERLLEAN